MEDIEQLTKLAEEMGADDLDSEAVSAAEEKLKLLMQNYRSSQQGISIHYSVYLLAFIVIFTTVGFFGYKLVHSLKEKERKKEEKRKLKELKKKK